ncbi:MucR family transcriptional regulator [Defluviimonas sp. 20V17]|uniref:Transcriptional regulator n=1 Tax=Allgaiera indica TaxID=765699 RepID=A0AAN4UNL4_9RHOB|nr:MucR family transcriptional regulator [Allgaiera indica]KDB03908.1 MucR family transcriptional regulator [Defluviimonas sp. 20V17]GHD99218.1 transcriptional regulator [Allgaiera indica]SDW31162.1 transcriptional regulator, MucR family [Allgaiera indica]
MNNPKGTDPSNTVAMIASAFAARPDTSIDDIVELVARLTRQFQAAPLGADHAIVTAPVARSGAQQAVAHPAMAPEQAVTEDKVYCLCCGKGFKMLKRHLGAEHGLTEDEYRARFNLPADMPLVAPSYSARKADYAKRMGLGKYRREDA